MFVTLILFATIFNVYAGVGFIGVGFNYDVNYYKINNIESKIIQAKLAEQQKQQELINKQFNQTLNQALKTIKKQIEDIKQNGVNEKKEHEKDLKILQNKLAELIEILATYEQNQNLTNKEIQTQTVNNTNIIQAKLEEQQKQQELINQTLNQVLKTIQDEITTIKKQIEDIKQRRDHSEKDDQERFKLGELKEIVALMNQEVNNLKHNLDLLETVTFNDLDLQDAVYQKNLENAITEIIQETEKLRHMSSKENELAISFLKAIQNRVKNIETQYNNENEKFLSLEPIDRIENYNDLEYFLNYNKNEIFNEVNEEIASLLKYETQGYGFTCLTCFTIIEGGYWVNFLHQSFNVINQNFDSINQNIKNLDKFAILNFSAIKPLYKSMSNIFSPNSLLNRMKGQMSASRKNELGSLNDVKSNFLDKIPSDYKIILNLVSIPAIGELNFANRLLLYGASFIAIGSIDRGYNFISYKTNTKIETERIYNNITSQIKNKIELLTSQKTKQQEELRKKKEYYDSKKKFYKLNDINSKVDELQNIKTEDFNVNASFSLSAGYKIEYNKFAFISDFTFDFTFSKIENQNLKVKNNLNFFLSQKIGYEFQKNLLTYVNFGIFVTKYKVSYDGLFINFVENQNIKGFVLGFGAEKKLYNSKIGLFLEFNNFIPITKISTIIGDVNPVRHQVKFGVRYYFGNFANRINYSRNIVKVEDKKF